jgi:hypothetical protein
LFADPPGRRRIGRVRRGWDTTVLALRATGRLEPIDEALIALGRVIADEADAAAADEAESRFVRNALLKTMLTTVTTMRDQTRPDADNASLDDLLAALDDSAHAGPPD